jgi:fructoselysine-6-P-deglycase FrlB-like protein
MLQYQAFVGIRTSREFAMSHAAEEIASQPACWRAALSIGAARPAGLPEPGERVAVTGCGTSHYMAQAYAALRESAGHGETDAWAASEFPAHRRYDRVVAFSRSGTTTEVLTALAALAPGVPTTAVVADAGTPLAGAARDVIVIDFADERSVVQTRFPTALLVLLRAHLGEDVSALPDLAERALAAPLPAGATGFRQYTFLGTGWTAALAREAGLKAREAAQVWAEAYPAMEYRHGPISVADHASLVWFFGPPPDGLVADVRRTGAQVEVAAGDPLVDLVRAQRLAVDLAVARGLDPDRPRNLARSIVLA